MNAAHPDNGGKARFFHALGYSASEVMHLVGALREIAASGETVHESNTAHGTKFVVDGELLSRVEEGKSRPLRTIWIVETGEDTPRLVTAYPNEG